MTRQEWTLFLPRGGTTKYNKHSVLSPDQDSPDPDDCYTSFNRKKYSSGTQKNILLLSVSPAFLKPFRAPETGATRVPASDDDKMQLGVLTNNESKGFEDSGGHKRQNALMELMQKFPQYNEDAVEQSTVDISWGDRYVHNLAILWNLNSKRSI